MAAQGTEAFQKRIRRGGVELSSAIPLPLYPLLHRQGCQATIQPPSQRPQHQSWRLLAPPHPINHLHLLSLLLRPLSPLHLHHLPLRLGHLFLCSGWDCSPPEAQSSTLLANQITRFPGRLGDRCSTVHPLLSPHLYSCRSHFSSQPALHPRNVPITPLARPRLPL